MQTSFKKEQRRSVINGTRPSLHNGQLLCSTGVPSLDAVIGGGVPVGSVCLIFEDKNHQYSNLLTRYFIAEGVVNGHGIYLASTENTSDSFMNHLPAPVTVDDDMLQTANDEMKIAWRYQNCPQVQTTTSTHSNYGNYYDISRTMSEELLRKSNMSYLNLREALENHTCDEEFDMFRHLVTEINDHIFENRWTIPSSLDPKKELNILRIVVPGFCSPFWSTGCGNINVTSAMRSLCCLRSIVRNSLSVCLITLPEYMYSTTGLELLKHNVDMVINLESFSTGKANPLYKDYHGLLKILKLPVLNSLLPFTPDSHEFAFKLRRKKFTIERLHLPPDIGENVQRQGVEEQEPTMRTMCGSSNTKSSIDF